MKLVEIQSSKNIMVTCGLEAVNLTDVNSHKDNKLKVNAQWSKYNVFIKKEKFYYPAEIKNWKTVRSLEKDGILTIGKEIDEEELDLEKLPTDDKEKIQKDKKLAEDAKAMKKRVNEANKKRLEELSESK